MSLVSRWYQTHQTPWSLRVLEATVRTLHTVLLLGGLAMVVWSLIAFLQMPVIDPTPPGPPPLLAAPTPQQATDTSLIGLGMAHFRALRQLPPAPQPPAPAPQPPAPPHPAPESPAPPPPSAHRGCPWFIYAFGAAGAATSVTSVLALTGVQWRLVCCLSANVLAMCLLLTVQALLAVAFFVDKSWEQLLPPETSGEYAAAKAFLESHLAVCKWAGVGVFLLQLLTTMLTCALQSSYVAVEEAAEDEDEDRRDYAAARRRPLLAQDGPTQPVGPPPGEEEAAWRRRMQQQYGLDVGEFERGGQLAATAGQRRSGSDHAGGRGCTLM